MRVYGAHGGAMALRATARACHINIHIKTLQFSYCARVMRAPRTPYPASCPIVAGLIALHAKGPCSRAHVQALTVADCYVASNGCTTI